MWSVIHKRKEETGRQVFPEASPVGGKTDSSGKHIARFSVRPNPQPMDPMKVTPAYELLLYDKLVRHLSSPEGVHREKSIVSLLELFEQNRENMVAAVRAGLVEALFSRLGVGMGEMEHVRRMVFTAFLKIHRTEYGRKEVLSDSRFKPLFKQCLIEDTSPSVRKEAILALREMCLFDVTAVPRRLFDAGWLNIVLKVIQHETDAPTRYAALTFFEALMKGSGVVFAAVHADAVGILMKAIEKAVALEGDGSDSGHSIIVACIRCLSFVAQHEEGKLSIVRLGCLNTLKSLIQLEWAVEDEKFSEAIASALSFITNSIVVAKKGCIEAKLLEEIVKLYKRWSHKSISTTKYLLQAIANLAEDPEARGYFSESILGDLRSDVGDERLDSLLDKAINIVVWKP